MRADTICIMRTIGVGGGFNRSNGADFLNLHITHDTHATWAERNIFHNFCMNNSLYFHFSTRSFSLALSVIAFFRMKTPCVVADRWSVDEYTFSVNPIWTHVPWIFPLRKWINSHFCEIHIIICINPIQSNRIYNLKKTRKNVLVSIELYK